MDIYGTAMEIGLFETALNLNAVGRSEEIVRKAGTAMPLPSQDIVKELETIVHWLLGFKKEKYLFLTPEIALVDALAHISGGEKEAIFVIPPAMEPDSRERLKKNIPRGMRISVKEAPNPPEDFAPSNGLLVACGYMAGDHRMVMNETSWLIEHWGNDFGGKKVFVPYVALDYFERCDGWREVASNQFNEDWRNA